MLVLSRKVGERIHIGDNVVILIVAVDGRNVRVGIEAPKSVAVRREELPERDTPVLDPTPDRARNRVLRPGKRAAIVASRQRRLAARSSAAVPATC